MAIGTVGVGAAVISPYATFIDIGASRHRIALEAGLTLTIKGPRSIHTVGIIATVVPTILAVALVEVQTAAALAIAVA